ncbi:ABC transporter substrate-binding protein [Paenibacillus sp. RU4T]|uniref:ABC transporter substrate-binding protein n=1 Tax=unclassified Paenibacillus TaxID=185978 RepID=UPI000954AE0A|nr:peptide/nickel transport system substrate-binding protein [Paenibacillus sp. RU4X]SIQ15462.1 peptide/nickel transport system substrate-binding protein [Paenibacillus sp. RU4T]
MAGSFKWKTLLVGVSVMGVLVAGCSSNSNNGSNSNSGAKTNTPASTAPTDNTAANAGATDPAGPKKGGTLTVGTFSDIVTTNPIYVADTSSGDAAYFMYSNLLDYDKDGNIVAQPWSLLESLPEISEDSKTYTVKLKANAKWNDGQPVTADDIAYTFDTLKNPEAASPGISSYDKVDKVEVIDPQTAKITLKSVYAPFINVLVSSIVPSHVLKDIPLKELEKNAFGTDPAKAVTNGPWKWTEWKQKQYLSFEKDANYWAKDVNDVNIDKVIYKIYADQNTNVQAIIKGDIDMVSGIPVTQVEAVKAKGLNVLLAPGPLYEYMSFNFNKMNWGGKDSPFAGEKTRQAIAYALNRQGILDNVLKGTGQALNAPFLPGTWADPGADAVTYNYDVEKSKALLAEDGWVADPKTGILSKNGQKFEFELQYNAGNSRREAVSAVIQDNLKAVGITVTPKAIDFSSWIEQNINPGKFQAILLSWSLNSPDPDSESIFSSKYFPPNGQNSGWYNNPTLDKLWVDGYSTTDQEKRKEIYKQVAQQISTNLPYVFLYQYGTPEVLGPRVKYAAEDAPVAALSYGYFFGINKWWVEDSK